MPRATANASSLHLQGVEPRSEAFYLRNGKMGKIEERDEHDARAHLCVALGYAMLSRNVGGRCFPESPRGFWVRPLEGGCRRAYKHLTAFVELTFREAAPTIHEE